jgi:hypothetical protein
VHGRDDEFGRGFGRYARDVDHEVVQMRIAPAHVVAIAYELLTAAVDALEIGARPLGRLAEIRREPRDAPRAVGDQEDAQHAGPAAEYDAPALAANDDAAGRGPLANRSLELAPHVFVEIVRQARRGERQRFRHARAQPLENPLGKRRLRGALGDGTGRGSHPRRDRLRERVVPEQLVAEFRRDAG